MAANPRREARATQCPGVAGRFVVQVARTRVDNGLMNQPFSVEQPKRAHIDAMPGPVLLQFGTDWCGHCQAAQAPVHQALGAYPGVRHIKVEDGPGRALGRSYSVTLWPTLVFLLDGHEVGRLVRPVGSAPVLEQLAQLVAHPH